MPPATSATAANSSPVRVLFATSECAPLVKTGGLGDVSAALPVALARLGVDMRMLLPAYRRVLAQMSGYRELARFAPSAGLPASRLLQGKRPRVYRCTCSIAPNSMTVRADPIRIKQAATGATTHCASACCRTSPRCLAAPTARSPGIRKCSTADEWQTGLRPAYLHHASGARAATLLTIHNLGFQGIFGPELVAALGLPPDSFHPDGVEYYGKLSFLKAGLQFADAISTVSPGYAMEIQSEPLGFGLQGLLAARKDRLYGILNGIDTDLWNPTTDPLIASHYSADTLGAKAVNKSALRARLGLASAADVPLFAVVSRLTEQKGLDWLLEIAPQLLALPAQLVLLGSGDPERRARLCRAGAEPSARGERDHGL